MNIDTIPTRIRVRGFSDEREIYINDDRLLPGRSQRLRNHSPDGFNWGYGGSGSAQLALAILLRFLNEDDAANLYQRFKFRFVAALPFNQDFDVTINLQEIIKEIL